MHSILQRISRHLQETGTPETLFGRASATFNGARHRLTIASDDAGFDAWLAGLPEADLPLRGHLVADLAVADPALPAEGRTATIEVLTVEER